MGVTEFCDLLKQTKEFDDLEVKIIKAMINLSRKDQAKVSAAMIAAETDISVTNAYKYLYALQQKGVVESMAGKNKIFWLARSANPFPRMFSYVTKDYFKKREMFDELAKAYKEFVRTDVVWFGEKMYEQYEGKFPDRASFIFDIAKSEIMVTTQKFFTDVVILDSLRRAVERGVKIKIISNEIDTVRMEGLKKIGIEVKLGRAWPYMAVVDGMHGITTDKDERGLWFLNCSTDYKNKFEEMWEKAEDI